MDVALFDCPECSAHECEVLYDRDVTVLKCLICGWYDVEED